MAAERMVRIELPGYEPSKDNRRVEFVFDGDTWKGATVVAVASDGRVKVEHDDCPNRPEWVDLTRRRYRWVL